MNHLTKVEAGGSRLPMDATEWPIVLLDSLPGRALSAPDENMLGQGMEYHVPDVEPMTYDAAVEYGRACTLAGGGWQLASRPEAGLIVDLERHSPAVDTRFFPTIDSSGWYWTRTPAAWSPGSYAWVVVFGHGSVGVDHRVGGHRVLLSRPRQ